MSTACQHLARLGISVFCPTLLTDTTEALLEACARWGAFISHWNGKGALPLGLHLEGPFLNPKVAGAHPPRLCRKPSISLMKRLVKSSRDTIAIVTLAPELPGAIPLIRALDHMGIRAQMGHSAATVEEALAGLKAGADGITHLFNAMHFHHRDPGLLGGLLRSPALTAEIITDGIHVSWDVVAWAARSLPGQLYAVSDGCSALGATAAQGRRGLTLGPVKLRKQGPVAVVASSGVLAGGAIPLPRHPKLLAAGLRAAGIELPPEIQHRLFTPPDCPKLKTRLMRVWSESG